MEIIPGTYLITGATGFIGSLITRYLLDHPEYLKGNIRIIGLSRDVSKVRRTYQNYDNSNLRFVFCDIINLKETFRQYISSMIDDKWIPDYLIHCAANTKSNVMIEKPVETADGIVIGTQNVLEIARDLHIKSMVYLSSMEVYGSIADTSKPIEESVLGEINLFNSRSCYPMGKRMAEQYCYCYFKEYEIPVIIARLAQVFGKGVLPDENRVFAQFAKAVIEDRDIILHTDGNSMGNYCDSMDGVEAIFTLLYKGVPGEAYNVVNEANTMSIRNMADIVANKIARDRIKVVYDIPKDNKYGYAAETGLRLSSEKLRTLGWKPKNSIEGMYRDLIEWINGMTIS